MASKVENVPSAVRRPWRMSIPLDHPATAEEAIRAAKLDWEVELVQAYAEGRPIPRARAVMRRDLGEPIAVVGERYAPIQNHEAFSFFDHLIREERAVYETAGAIDRGRRVWLQARLPEDIWVTEEDVVEKYLLLSTSHDGRTPLEVVFTPIRVVCKNTLLAALAKGKSTGITIRHVGDTQDKAEQARRLLDLSISYYENWEDQARALAGYSLTSKTARLYFEGLVPLPKKADPTRARLTRKALMRLFEEGKGNDRPGVFGTLWTAVNAVAEFVDHERPTRRSDGATVEEKRFKSAMFGSGASLKKEAWSHALTLFN